MTREDAKIFLYSVAGDLGFTDVENYTCKDGEKMREAIETLEQEPCEDAISRQAVLDLMADYDLSMGQVVRGIHALPSVNPQPKTGHWLYIRNSEVNGLKIVECSECGKRTYGSGNYCPNCGAKMVKPQESEVSDADSD